MTSNEDAEIRKHGYKPLKRRSPTPLYYPLIPHGVGWHGAQSEPERCLPVHEAPPCTTLAVRHASPRPSRYVPCVQLSHGRRTAGANRFDGWLTTGHVNIPATHIDFACYRGISPLRQKSPLPVRPRKKGRCKLRGACTLCLGSQIYMLNKKSKLCMAVQPWKHFQAAERSSAFRHGVSAPFDGRFVRETVSVYWQNRSSRCSFDQ